MSAEPVSDRIEELVQTSRKLLEVPELRSIGHLLPVVFRIQAEGRAVTAEEVAATTGRSAGEVAELLRDYLPIGDPRLPGHSVHLHGAERAQTVHGCAADALAVGVLVGRPARVTSRCHATGQQVTVDLGPGGVTRVQPVGAVVSLVPTGDPADLAASICMHGHFFVSAEAAADWQAEHPDGAVVSMADAFRYIEGVFGEFIAPAA